jgi:DNA-binding LacI/PurR family transcriptional regulator
MKGYLPDRMAKPPNRPTIADVAREAGVSTAAVSFAVNGRAGVGEATRRRILDTAATLGWRPSARARALSSSRAGAVGLVLARELRHLEVDPFFVRFLSGVERGLAPHDEALLLQVVDAPAAEVDVGAYERLIAAGRVDGFLLTDVRLEDPRFALLAAAGVPAAVAGRPVGDCPFPAVETRHAEGMARLVEHLVGLGHRTVGFLGGLADHEHVARRRAEWEAALRAAGLPAGPDAHATPADPDGRAAAAALLAGDPSAIACTSDPLALGAIAVARERGLRVPGDLSVAGFDDSPLAALADLATVRIDYAGLGEAAAAALMALVAGAPAPPFSPAAPELVLRGSIRACRARPPG